MEGRSIGFKNWVTVVFEIVAFLHHHHHHQQQQQQQQLNYLIVVVFDEFESQTLLRVDDVWREGVF